MSLILDALRKMELERKAKRLDSLQVRSEVLSYRGNPQTPVTPRLLPVIAALLVFSAAAAGLIYFTGSATRPAETAKTAAPIATASRIQLPEPPTTSLSPVQQPTPLPTPAARPVKPVPLARVANESASTAETGEKTSSPADSNIAVSGIAWQDERSLRRAVVNGSLVGEGAEVIGAKVIEIRQNLVRFSRDGRSFDVIYTSGLGR
jgi:general secretion pathway protein B